MSINYDYVLLEGKSVKKFKLQLAAFGLICGISILQATGFDEFGGILPDVAVDIHENGSIILNFEDGESYSVKRHASFQVNPDKVHVVLDSVIPKQGYVSLIGSTPWENEQVEFSLHDGIESFEVQQDVPQHTPEESYTESLYSLNASTLPKPVGFDLPDGDYVKTPTTPKKIYYLNLD